MKPLSAEQISAILDECLEVEFSFIKTEELVRSLKDLGREEQKFILDWTQRAASTNVELGFQFASRAQHALTEMKQEMVEAWCLNAMDSYDHSGLHKAMEAIQDLEGFLELGHKRSAGSLFEDASPILTPFIHGLSGRKLKIVQDTYAWTDGETIYLPEIMAHLDDQKENFQLYKSIVAQLWAQTRYGCLNINLVEVFAAYPDPEQAQVIFNMLESIRLDARIADELPGLYRKMQEISGLLDDTSLPVEWKQAKQELEQPSAEVQASLEWLQRLYGQPSPAPRCYQGRLNPEAAWEARLQRLLRDKARLRDLLRVVADEIAEGREDRKPPDSFKVNKKGLDEKSESFEFEITLSDMPVAVPEQVNDLLTSVMLDLGEIPPEYLTPAGPGEYDQELLKDREQDASDAWAGTYHEEGAALYNEWDVARQAYKRNWCVLRELEVEPTDDSFYQETIAKYGRFIHSIRRTFEVMRGEDRLLRRQRFGDDVDIDALVEAWGDVCAGREMTDRLFTRMHKEDRNIAVLFMVDMSGSTRGWINDAERESLILLAEALETLGDRYAVYGFSGWTRKRCEVFRIKEFDEPWNEQTIGRVCAIEPKDYTRMGAPIRHFVEKLKGIEARTKLLVTLSDGKPDDYDLEYRGEYGIEDTRQALYEARREGVHSFCITIDKEGQEYLPHMYGAANYVVIEDVQKLPMKVSEVYRRLTT